MASAIFISTILPPMAAKAMDIIKDKGKTIGKYIADKTVDKAVDKVMDIVNIDGDISKLQTTLRMIQSIVRVAEEKQIDDDFIWNWLTSSYDVDVGYEARDVLDDFITFSSCVITAEEASNPVNFISSFIMKYVGGSSSDTSNIPLAILNRLAKDIRSVREKFDEKKEEGRDFMTLISVGGGGGSESVKNRRPEVGPSINKQRDSLFLGREVAKEGIMQKILHPSDDRVDVVVIWGMGGIGKTTLAQSIYNDERVKKVPRRWLSVGVNKFSAEKVIREIVNDKETIGIENLQTKLKEKLKGDRFLIVLDDVWDVDGSEWDLLFNPLTEVGKGGLIIITRRESELCAAITIQTTYNLKPLSEEDSWSIFESCAYVNGKSDRTPDLKGIGKQIVKKLNGLPLALKVVGRSLLHKDYSTWTKFLESKLTKHDEVMSALRWSYSHLPPHLKMCFTYCALFPKDHVLDKKVMVEMWMAHDLIEKEERERPEDVGAQYFEELVNASMFQCVDGKHVMHDLIHDLALLVSNGEFATANGVLTNDQMKKVRHITITRGDYSKIPRLCKIEKLLTLYTTDDEIYPIEKYDLDVFKQLKSIRVLVLVSSEITEIPDCISELRHLRYLDVRRTSVKRLPDSLCRLYNLQMLAAPLDELALPIDIVNISNLRYVRAHLSTCKGVGKLTSLQELSSIRVREVDNIGELRDMQRLRGRLNIEGLENVSTLEGDGGALMEKQTLMEELELKFDKQLENSTIYEEVLRYLGCPPNLTYLKLRGLRSIKPPSWMVDGKHKFNKLQTLHISTCPKLESLPPLGGFDKLQALELYGCSKLESLPALGELTSLKSLILYHVGVKRLGDEFYGKFTNGKAFFPYLESLVFVDMKEWEEWDDIITENSSVSFFPRLTELHIYNCAKLVSVLPVVKNPIMNAANFMTSLSSLEICNCDGLKRLQLDALVSLKKLYMYNCPQLQSLPLYFHKLSSLENLSIDKYPQLQSLPLDFHELSSLKELYIYDCPQLQSLPADGFSPSLRYLEIKGCPLLYERCKDESGFDWHKINHISARKIRN